ncbi:MAG: M48 family metallopeptidase [Firmicutes bacterium]|nr:M48 family metallopeptidase [Bacillota bacterium]
MKESGFDFNYTVKRSRRHSSAIQIKEDGEVVVRVPFLTPDWAVRELVRSKEAWIRKHLTRIRENRSIRGGKFFEEKELTELKKLARKDIPPRVEHFARVMGLRYGKVAIRAQRTRWGSCSAKGNLNFNCLLVLLPDEVRDYVVVHELAHLKEMNHSPRFWAEVGKVIPDYKLRRAQLRELGRPLISMIK